jgi:hypothetical protein
MTRISLADVSTADLGPVPEIPVRQPRRADRGRQGAAAKASPAADGRPARRGRRPAAKQPAPGDAAAADGQAAKPPRARRPAARPAAADLVGPARRVITREALKADVPAELALVERLHRYRLDHGVDIRDQVALALDAWLTGLGY